MKSAPRSLPPFEVSRFGVLVGVFAIVLGIMFAIGPIGQSLRQQELCPVFVAIARNVSPELLTETREVDCSTFMRNANIKTAPITMGARLVSNIAVNEDEAKAQLQRQFQISQDFPDTPQEFALRKIDSEWRVLTPETGARLVQKIEQSGSYLSR